MRQTTLYSAGDGDLDTVRSLLHGGAADQFAGVATDEQLAAWLADADAALPGRIADAGTHVLLAVQQDLVVGTGTVQLRPPAPPHLELPAGWAECGSLYCSHRSRGAGSALLDALLGTARHHGATGVFLTVAPGNRPMHALARPRGLTEVARYRDDRHFGGAEFLVLGRPLHQPLTRD